MHAREYGLWESILWESILWESILWESILWESMLWESMLWKAATLTWGDKVRELVPNFARSWRLGLSIYSESHQTLPRPQTGLNNTIPRQKASHL